MELRDASSAEIDGILSGTHALWSDGLDPDAYGDFIRTLMATDWARQGGYRFLVLIGDRGGAPLAGMKLYRFTARLGGEAITVGGIGAVFTPPELRRHGHAATMLRMSHAIMAERGDRLSLLFSEIGAGYYSRLGYLTMDARPARLVVPPEPAVRATPPPAPLQRMHRNDLDRIMALRDDGDAGSPFALTRDRTYWKYLLARASYPTLALGRERWESRLMMAGRHGYLWSLFGDTHEGSSAKLLEFAEAEPGAALPALLDDFHDECRRRGATHADVWNTDRWMRADPRLAASPATQHEPAAALPPSAVPMWLPLDLAAGAAMERAAGSALLQLTDLF